ncbi:MAG: helix-turn-helix domain-containing protein [Bacillota bacterium]
MITLPGIGNKLRIKRLALGLSLKDVSRKTRIKQKALEALEEEEILKFKDKVDVLEHIKSYASALGLNSTEVLADFEKLWSDSSTAKAYMQQQYNRENRFAFLKEQKFLSYGAVIAAFALFLSFGGYLFWNNYFVPNEPEQYEAVSADEMGLEESAEEEPVKEKPVVEDPDLEEPIVAEREKSDPNQETDDYIANADNGLEEPMLEEEEEGQHITSPDEDGLPRTGEFAYLLWFGILTFIIGLALFLPVLLFRKDCDPVLGPSN